MDCKTDLTNFWLAWDATCAIRDCMNTERLVEKCKERIVQCDSAEQFERVIADAENVSRLAREVIKATNNEFIEKLNYYSCEGRFSSVYADDVVAWKGCCGSAFEIVEGMLYEKQTIKGRAFKSYLFEEIGPRTGGMSKNLYGYIKFTIRTLVRDSFSKESAIEERKDEEGNLLSVYIGSTDDRMDVHSRSAELNFEIEQVKEFFFRYIKELESERDKDFWISLYAGLHKMPINNPEVASLCRRSKSALAEVYKKTMGDLLIALRGHFSDRAIGGALEGGMQDVLIKEIDRMEFYPALEHIWRKMYCKTGK